jgi:hypothetical protein
MRRGAEGVVMSLGTEYATRLYEFLAKVWAEMKAVKGWNLQALYDVVADAVEEAEAIAQEIGGLDGATRKEMVIDAVNALIDIPLLPEWAEKKVFEGVLGLLIDQVVALLNRKIGHDWFAQTRAVIESEAKAQAAEPNPSGMQITHEQELAARIPPGAALPT